jgi:hypothetical protein
LAFSNAFGGDEYSYFRNESNNSGGGGGAGRKYQSEEQWQIQQTFMIGAAILGLLSLFCGFTTACVVKEQRLVTGQSASFRQHLPTNQGQHLPTPTKGSTCPHQPRAALAHTYERVSMCKPPTFLYACVSLFLLGGRRRLLRKCMVAHGGTWWYMAKCIRRKQAHNTTKRCRLLYIEKMHPGKCTPQAGALPQQPSWRVCTMCSAPRSVLAAIGVCFRLCLLPSVLAAIGACCNR